MKYCIKYYLGYQGFFFFVSANIYWLKDDNKDKWFSRICLSCLCLGFYGIMEYLNNNKNNKH